MPLLSSSKSVLLLTDDALCVYKVGGREVRLTETLGWRAQDFEAILAGILQKEVGDGSVLILNDAVEQHYRKEKIAKLTALDRANIIKRRLNIAFPNYPTRAALPLKEKKRKGVKTPPAEENVFLFAATPSTDSFKRLMESIRRSDSGISSYRLLPIESIGLVDKISDRLAKDTKQSERATWCIMLGQHHGGGLRQIVTKGGQIALTRITPVIAPDDTNAAQWASEVVQEIQSTISYLGRFGYSQDDGLDIILVCRPDFGDLVGDMINISCNYNTINLQRAAELAGINVGRNLDPHYADPLHVAWAAKKVQPTLPMASREIEAIANPRKAAFFGMLLLTAAFGYLSYNISNEIQAVNSNTLNLVEVNKLKVAADQIYADEIKRKESLGIDVNLIQNSLAVYKDMNAQSFDALPVIQTVGEELRDLHIDTLTVSSDRPAGGAADAPIDPNAATATFSKSVSLVAGFIFPGTIRPQDGNKQIANLRDRLAAKLPDYTVQVTKQLADLSYTGEFTNETGLTAQKRSAQDVYTAEITIQRNITNAPSSGT